MKPPADDDQAWADALAGRPAAADATAAEAALLREALRRWPAQPPRPQLDEAALLAAARAQGLLPPARRGCAPCAAIRRRLFARPVVWGGLGGLALAAVLGLAILPGLLVPPEDGAVLRSPAGGWQLQAGDPVAARDALAARLRAAGADVQTYERAGRAGLDAEFATPPDATLRAWLAERGLATAADGSLRVEYRRRGE